MTGRGCADCDEDEIEYLRARIYDLEKAFATPTPDPTLGLAAAEVEFLIPLARWGTTTAGAYAERRGCSATAARQIVWRCRRKLGPHGVEIANVKGERYVVDAESRARLRVLLGI